MCAEIACTGGRRAARMEDAMMICGQKNFHTSKHIRMKYAQDGPTGINPANRNIGADPEYATRLRGANISCNTSGKT